MEATPLLAVALLLIGTLPLAAQGQSLPLSPAETPEPPQEEEPHPWTYDMGVRFSGSQAAYSNWQEGGETMKADPKGSKEYFGKVNA